MPKEINPEYSLEGLTLKLNLQYFATLCKELTHWKRHWYWERLRAGGEGDHRRWDNWMASSTQWTWVWAKFGDGEGQGSLASCSPWSHKEFDMTEWLNNNNRFHLSILPVVLPNHGDLSRSSLCTHIWHHGFYNCHSEDTPLNYLAVTSWTCIYRSHRTETNRETLLTVLSTEEDWNAHHLVFPWKRFICKIFSLRVWLLISLHLDVDWDLPLWDTNKY